MNSRKQKRKLCGCRKHFRRPGQRDCRFCHARSERKRRSEMVLVPRGLLPVELHTARARKSATRLRKIPLTFPQPFTSIAP